MLRRLVPATAAIAAVLAATVTVTTAPTASAAAPPPAGAFPEVIPLPDGFRPEGIASGHGAQLFVGSIPTGAVYRIDARTGRGAVLVPGAAGRAATGLKVAGGVLYVSGADTGKAFLYDARTGADLAELTLTTVTPAFVNDVVVTRSAAFFTDSLNPVLYRVDRRTRAVTTIPLTGDLRYEPGFNVNGIDATDDGQRLVLVQSNTGRLFTADPRTGATREIALAHGESVPMGDGILLAGRTLYVVQNRSNLIAEVRLDAHLRSGAVVSRTGNAAFDVPTTVARLGHRLYVVNARFGNPSPDTATYSVVGLPRP